MAIRYESDFMVCDTFVEVQSLSPSVSYALCLEEGRKCFYFYDGGQWKRIAGKFTSIDPSSPLDMGSGVLTMDISGFATPAYVDNAINTLLGITPAELDTFQEIASKLAELGSADTAIFATIGGDHATIEEHTAQIAKTEFNTIEVNITDEPRRSGSFDIEDLSGLTPNAPAQVFQIAGVYTDKGALTDEAEMDSVNVSAYCTDETTIRCCWNATGAVRGNFQFAYRS